MNEDQNNDLEQSADQTPEPQQNPIDAAVTAITYGEEDAPAKLRTAIGQTISESQAWRDLAEEEARSKQVLNEFLEEHPELKNDEDVSALGHMHVVRQMREDLSQALDLAKWEKEQGRAASPQEISSWHLQQRTARNPAVRDPHTLLEGARLHLRDRFGVGRDRDLDESRTDAVAQRQERAAVITGKRLINWSHGKSSDSDPHITEAAAASPEAETSRGFGADVTAPPDRASAVERMIMHRRALRQSVNPAGFTASGGKRET
jgi:hypothetical protein